VSRVFFGHPPAATGAQVVVPDATALTFAIPSPTVVKGAISRVPDATGLTFTVPTPTVLNVKTVVANPIALTFALPTPTRLIGAVSRTPDATPLTFALPSPALVKGAISRTPNATPLTFTIPNPTISTGTALVASPTSLTFALPSPTLVKGAVSRTPTPVPLTFSLPNPTVVTGSGAQTFTAEPVALLFSLPSIGVVGGGAAAVPDPYMPGRRSRRTKKEDLLRFGMEWLIDPAEREGPRRVERAPVIARALVAEAKAARARGEPYVRGGLLEIPRDLVIPFSDLQPFAIMPDIVTVIRTARARAATKAKRDALDRYARHLAARAREAIEAEIEIEDEEMVLSAEGWW
jgi:hypothetical protein